MFKDSTSGISLYIQEDKKHKILFSHFILRNKKKKQKRKQIPKKRKMR